MADISSIKLPSGTTYEIKDSAARESLTGYLPITGSITSETDLSNLATGMYAIENVSHSDFPESGALFGCLIQGSGDYKPQFIIAGGTGESNLYTRRWLTASDSFTDWTSIPDAPTAGDGIDITTNVISNTQGIEYIVGTQTAATNAWTGVSTDSSLSTGKIIAYKLPYAGTSTAATLQLTMADGTTTSAIALRRTGSSTVTTHFAADNVIVMIYDGTYWRVSAYYDANTNTVPTGYCTTGAGTAAKSATCNYGYRDDPTYFPCLFRYANTAANATLAIASYATTALPIYVNGARTTSSNTFGRGVVMFLYYNNAYYCYNDGRFPIVLNGSVTSIQDALANYTTESDVNTLIQTALSAYENGNTSTY